MSAHYQSLIIEQPAWDEMARAVRAAAPEEACGLLAGTGGRVSLAIPVENLLHSPVAFQMEPRAQLRALRQIEHAGLDLIAIYHSHPAGPPGPSETDQRSYFYPGTLYVIWSAVGGAWTARAYGMQPTVREVAVTIQPVLA